MRYIFLFIAILFIFSTGFTQTNVYHPFPNDSALWLERRTSVGGDSYSTIIWLGDTVINGKKYIKNYEMGTYGWAYTGGTRQDIPNEKVYAVDKNGIEIDVTVSQHLNPGDIYMIYGGWDTIYVNTIDSILIGNTYRKKYNTSNNMSSSSGQRVERVYVMGVGEIGAGGFEWGEQLYCFSVKDVRLYPVPVIPGWGPPCPLLPTSVTEAFSIENEILITPNPGSGIFFISSDKKIIGMDVVTILGEKIYSSESNSARRDESIDLSKEKNGIYFLQIKTEQGIANKKIVLQK